MNFAQCSAENYFARNNISNITSLLAFNAIQRPRRMFLNCRDTKFHEKYPFRFIIFHDNDP